MHTPRAQDPIEVLFHCASEGTENLNESRLLWIVTLDTNSLVSLLAVQSHVTMLHTVQYNTSPHGFGRTVYYCELYQDAHGYVKDD